MQKYLILLLIALVFTACTDKRYFRPDTFLIPDDFDYRYTQTLTEDQREEDIEMLRAALEFGYIGEYVMRRNHFWKMYDKLEDLEDAEYANTLRFCDGLGDALDAVPDGRLTAKLDNRFCGKTRWERFLPTVGENVGKLDPENYSNTWTIHKRHILGYDVSIVSILRFDFHKFSVWNEYVKRLRDVFASEILIVDLRGSQGNDPTAAKVLVQALVGGSVSTGFSREYTLRSPHTYALIANRWELDINALTRDQIPIPDMYMQLQRRFERRAKRMNLVDRINKDEYMKRYLREKSIQDIRYNDYRNLPFPSWVFVLTDGACRAACEEAVLLLKTHPLTRVIGQKTAGSLQFDRIGAIVLPHSKIKVFIPTRYHQLTEKDREEVMRGIEPDLVIESGRDAMDFAINEAVHHFL